MRAQFTPWRSCDTFFCVPECKGKSLEQIDRMFNEGISPGKFVRYAPEEAQGEDVGVVSKVEEANM